MTDDDVPPRAAVVWLPEPPRRPLAGLCQLSRPKRPRAPIADSPSLPWADGAGDANARYGHDPGLGFYTHVSDQHGPYSVRAMSATSHEVLDGLLHHGTALQIDTHYTDTGGASDHVFILCAMLSVRFCPRLRDFPAHKLASIEPPATYKTIQPLVGRRIRTDVIREHWDEVLRLAASLRAGTIVLHGSEK